MGQLVSTFLPPWARPYWNSIIENPLNLALFGVCVPLGVFLLWPPESSSPLSMPSVKEARSLMPTAQYSTLPAEHAKSIEWIRYTPRTLALHDGTQGEHSQILLAIDGHVFDVSSGRNFYGPNGPYGNFAGRDASRGMAKQSFALGVYIVTHAQTSLRRLTSLSIRSAIYHQRKGTFIMPSHPRRHMEEWISHFRGKYPIVGQLVNEGDVETC